MRIEKGQPGYLKAQKVKYLIWALGEFVVVVGLVVLGYIQTGSKLNLLPWRRWCAVFRRPRCWWNSSPWRLTKALNRRRLQRSGRRGLY